MPSHAELSELQSPSDLPLFAADPTRAKELFEQARDRDLGAGKSELASWLFTDRKIAAGHLTNMEFYDFLGPEHLNKFFGYIKNFKFPHYFRTTDIEPLRHVSVDNDMRALGNLGIKTDKGILDNIGLYNAQDFMFQRAYAVPPSQSIERVLDFGAGHGRLANLSLSPGSGRVKTYFAVDAIPASYLTQNMYYNSLGHKVYDYIEHQNGKWDSENIGEDYDVVHLPTWRMDLLPRNYFDMICCVQVLRELSPKVFFYALEHFSRILKPGGALYVRDHVNFHNPSGLPQDEILQANGFLLEFYPRVHDAVDVHGVPRIWRKLDSSRYI